MSTVWKHQVVARLVLLALLSLVSVFGTKAYAQCIVYSDCNAIGSVGVANLDGSDTRSYTVSYPNPLGTTTAATVLGIAQISTSVTPSVRAASHGYSQAGAQLDYFVDLYGAPNTWMPIVLAGNFSVQNTASGTTGVNRGAGSSIGVGLPDSTGPSQGFYFSAGSQSFTFGSDSNDRHVGIGLGAFAAFPINFIGSISATSSIGYFIWDAASGQPLDGGPLVAVDGFESAFTSGSYEIVYFGRLNANGQTTLQIRLDAGAGESVLVNTTSGSGDASIDALVSIPATYLNQYSGAYFQLRNGIPNGAISQVPELPTSGLILLGLIGIYMGRARMQGQSPQS